MGRKTARKHRFNKNKKIKRKNRISGVNHNQTLKSRIYAWSLKIYKKWLWNSVKKWMGLVSMNTANYIIWWYVIPALINIVYSYAFDSESKEKKWKNQLFMCGALLVFIFGGIEFNNLVNKYFESSRISVSAQFTVYLVQTTVFRRVFENNFPAWFEVQILTAASFGLVCLLAKLILCKTWAGRRCILFWIEYIAISLSLTAALCSLHWKLIDINRQRDLLQLE